MESRFELRRTIRSRIVSAPILGGFAYPAPLVAVTTFVAGVGLPASFQMVAMFVVSAFFSVQSVAGYFGKVELEGPLLHISVFGRTFRTVDLPQSGEIYEQHGMGWGRFGKSIYILHAVTLESGFPGLRNYFCIFPSYGLGRGLRREWISILKEAQMSHRTE